MRKLSWAFLLFLITLFSGCSKEKHILVQGYIEGQFIYLSSSMSGILKSLAIYRGNRVSVNQKLFVLDQEPEQSGLNQAEANLESAKENYVNLVLGQRQTILEGIIAQRQQAKADLIYAKQTVTRYKELFQQGAISKDQLDQAISDYRAKSQLVDQYEANLGEAKLGARDHVILAQQASVTAQKADIEKYAWQLQQKTVYAQNEGQIFDTFYKEGEFVPAGAAVAALLTPDNIKVIFYVPEKLLSILALKKEIIFKCDHCALQHATITYISPQAEYTPPVIYSRESRDKLVYRVECTMAPDVAIQYHPGQPIDVLLDNPSESHA